MAILFRNISEFTIGGMTARLTVYSGSADRIRVEIAPYNSATTTPYTGSLDVTVTYNGDSKNLSASPFTKSVSAIFTGVNEVKTVTISSSAEILYEGTAASSCDISWKGDGTAAAPELAVSGYSGLLIGKSSRIEWAVDGVPEGYRAYTIGVWCHYASGAQIAPDYTRSCVLDRKTADFAFEHTVSGLELKNVVFYRIAVGLYPEDGADAAGRDDYVLYTEIDSPAYVCSGDAIYTLAPYELRYSGLKKNRVVNVTWKILAAAAETKGFQLEYTYDAETWNELFRNTCASNSYSFTVPEGETKIAFRIRSYSTRSKYELSEYVYGPWLEVSRSNVYVGHNGSVVPAAEIHIGSRAADAVLNVG